MIVFRPVSQMAINFTLRGPCKQKQMPHGTPRLSSTRSVNRDAPTASPVRVGHANPNLAPVAKRDYELAGDAGTDRGICQTGPCRSHTDDLTPFCPKPLRPFRQLAGRAGRGGVVDFARQVWECHRKS